MDSTEQIAEKEGILDHVEAFSETFLKLTLTTITQKGVNVSSVILNTFFIYLALIFVILFAAVGLAWWIGDLINNRAGGFFIVAGFFLFVTILIILLRKKVLYPFIRNLIVRKIYE
ncbi:MAG: hypothetical protein QM764_11665 [Chitinophagaceae bacterium]